MTLVTYCVLIQVEFTFPDCVLEGARDLIFKTIEAQPQPEAHPSKVLEHPWIAANSKPSSCQKKNQLANSLNLWGQILRLGLPYITWSRVLACFPCARHRDSTGHAADEQAVLGVHFRRTRPLWQVGNCENIITCWL